MLESESVDPWNSGTGFEVQYRRPRSSDRKIKTRAQKPDVGVTSQARAVPTSKMSQNVVPPMEALPSDYFLRFLRLGCVEEKPRFRSR